MDDHLKVVAWQARFEKCPHCNRSLSIISNSRGSKNESVNKMIVDLNFHLDKICKVNDKKKKITDFKIRLEKKGISEYGATYTTYSWENNRIIC